MPSCSVHSKLCIHSFVALLIIHWQQQSVAKQGLACNLLKKRPSPAWQAADSLSLLRLNYYAERTLGRLCCMRYGSKSMLTVMMERDQGRQLHEAEDMSQKMSGSSSTSGCTTLAFQVRSDVEVTSRFCILTSPFNFSRAIHLLFSFSFWIVRCHESSKFLAKSDWSCACKLLRSSEHIDGTSMLAGIPVSYEVGLYGDLKHSQPVVNK